MFIPISFATDRYVATNGGSISPYTSWDTAATNIQWAVNVGTNGDRVLISNGTYVLTNTVTVSAAINIYGYPDGSLPVVDGNSNVKCFSISAGASLSNLWITRGYAAGDGGGIYMLTTGSVQNCVISNNIANNRGGGVWLDNGTLKNCIITCNMQTNTTTTANWGGGGVLFDGGLILNCIIERNSAGWAGGAVYINANLQVASTLLQNCMIRNNTAEARGGGLYYWSFYNEIVSSCTIVSNYSSLGGGVCNNAAGGRIMYENCIIYSNIPANVYSFTGRGAFYTNCCIPSIPAPVETNVNPVTANPQFVNWTSQDYHLLNTSPCVNTGTNRSWMGATVDLDNKPRISGRIVDIGVYEFTSQYLTIGGSL